MIPRHKIRNFLASLGLMDSTFKKNIRQAIVENRAIADLLESTICGGEYHGVFMCNILKHRAIADPTLKETAKLAIAHINERIGTQFTLINYLSDVTVGTPDWDIVRLGYTGTFISSFSSVSTPRTHEEELKFLEVRLLMTKWYWEEIRALRQMAVIYQHDLKSII